MTADTPFGGFRQGRSAARGRCLFAALASALLVAACAGGMEKRATGEPIDDRLPATMAMPSSARVENDLAIERWWLLFDDAELNRLIDQALARNADIAIAAARLREARARFDEVRGGQQPALQLQAQSARARTSADVSGTPEGRLGSRHEVALVADYEIDLWGRLAAGTEAANAQLAVQEWARAAVQWSITAQVAEAHFALRALRGQIRIAQAVRESRDHTAALRRAEHRAGATSEFELRRAEAELASSESTLATLDRQRLAQEALISLLAGDSLETLGQKAAERPALDPASPFAPRLPQGALAELLQRRPDLRQAEAELHAARADVDAARAASLPALRLIGSVGGDAREISNLFSATGFAWSLAANLTQSIFDGGRQRSRVVQAEARSEAAIARYRRQVATALTEVREAYLALDVQQRAWEAESQRVKALAKAESLAQLGMRIGAFSQIDALDAERNYFNAQLAEVDAYRARLVGQVAVFKAVGGGHPRAALSVFPVAGGLQ